MSKVILNMKTIENREEKKKKNQQRMKEYKPENHVFTWGSIKKERK